MTNAHRKALSLSLGGVGGGGDGGGDADGGGGRKRGISAVEGGGVTSNFHGEGRDKQETVVPPVRYVMSNI